MPNNSLADYDSTSADNNTDIGGISIAEGMLPSAVNNSIRELTKQLGAMADGTDALTALSVDNLKLDGNTIVSTDTNGNINLTPDGTGTVTVDGNVSVDGGTIKLDGNYPVGTRVVGVGDTALANVDSAVANITAVGHAALNALTTGLNNTAFGDRAGTAVTTGADNTFIGAGTGIATTTASNNTAVGHTAMLSNTTGASNVAVGNDALQSNTTASNNTAVGHNSLYSNTTGTSNVAFGSFAGYGITTGNNNIAIGKNAINSTSAGNNNTAVGNAALNTTTGSDNTGVGKNVLDANTSGASNTAVGSDALGSNTTASSNTAVGYQALYDNTTGNVNTAVGQGAAANVTTGNANTALGRAALATATTAGSNTAVGSDALEIATGAGNTAIGQGSGSLITTGAYNTILGRYNGNQGGLDIRTSSNNIVLSDGDGNPRLKINSAGNAVFNGGQYVLGINSGTYTWYMGTISNRFDVYDNSGTLRGYLTQAGAWTDTSDTAFKRDISDLTYGITTVKALQPRVYHVEGTTGTDDPQIGFVAQEIEAHVPEVVTGEDGSKGVAYGRLTAVLTKALQEAIAKIETLEAKVSTLEGAN